MLSLTNFAIKKTMDICTKVTLRQRLLPSGKITLYLDYYPAIRNPKTNRSQRHEYMGIYLYGNPTNQVQRNFNKTMLEKAELIRCRRQEQVINRQFGFIDHTQQREDFLAYFEGVCKKRYEKWKIVFMHFRKVLFRIISEYKYLKTCPNTMSG